MKMKKPLLFLITLTFLSGCAYSIGNIVCRHEAAVCALMAGERYPVRIAFGPTKKQFEWHAQAQAYIDGKWEWLHLRRESVFIVEKDILFEDLNYWSVSDYVNKYLIKSEE